jgi:hypothetical protein
MYFPIPQPSLRLVGVESNKARSLLEEGGRSVLHNRYVNPKKMQVKQFYY